MNENFLGRQNLEYVSEYPFSLFLFCTQSMKNVLLYGGAPLLHVGLYSHYMELCCKLLLQIPHKCDVSQVLQRNSGISGLIQRAIVLVYYQS